MNDFFSPTLDPHHPKEHIDALPAQSGTRSLYDSVCFCNRCNMCAQSCPTFRLRQEEFSSPRGRNQILRLVLEGKFKIAAYRRQIEQSMASCLLCGACSAACPGKTPTAEHVLEMQRALGIRPLPFLLHKILSWRTASPRLFDWAATLCRLAHNGGAVKLLRFSGLTQLPFLRWVNHADDILPRKIVFLRQHLKKTVFPQNPGVLYLPSLEAAYLDGSLGLAAWHKLQEHQPAVLFGLSSGLFEYVYGSLRHARHAAQKLMMQAGNGTAPIVTDSADVYFFIKNYPRLFAHSKVWQRKARRLASRVRFIADYLPKKAKAEGFGRVQIDPSALFSFENEAFEKTEKIFRVIFKKNLLHYGYRDTPTPPFGYSFRKGNLSKQVCFCRVKDIARTQTDTVFFLSGLSALELNYWLKKYYPGAKAEHIVRLNG